MLTISCKLTSKDAVRWIKGPLFYRTWTQSNGKMGTRDYNDKYNKVIEVWEKINDIPTNSVIKWR